MVHTGIYEETCHPRTDENSGLLRTDAQEITVCDLGLTEHGMQMGCLSVCTGQVVNLVENTGLDSHLSSYSLLLFPSPFPLSPFAFLPAQTMLIYIIFGSMRQEWVAATHEAGMQWRILQMGMAFIMLAFCNRITQKNLSPINSIEMKRLEKRSIGIQPTELLSLARFSWCM